MRKKIFDLFRKANSFFYQKYDSEVPKEALMYRFYLFKEFIHMSKMNLFHNKRILEIGPKDGLDSKRLNSLHPDELVMLDLPEKSNLVRCWIEEISCKNKYIEKNLMYMSEEEINNLGKFDLIWCTGVLYHNAEQMRFLRKIYKLLNYGGYFVLESATLRGPKKIQNGCYVEIFYPDTFRNTGTITHLPTIKAIKAWLSMVGFDEIYDSSCYQIENQDLTDQRYACICKKNNIDNAGVYYGKSGDNPVYKFGDST